MSLKSLSPEELAQFVEIMKTFGPKFGTGPTLKRYEIGDGLGGYEFRPFGKWNYGYPMQEWLLTSWPVWLIEAVFTFSESWTRGFAINALAHIIQESTVMREHAGDLSGGASFVHNFLAGYNLVRNWNAKSGMKLWARYAGYLELGTNAALIPYERVRLEAEFGTLIGHKYHALGFAIGSMVALI